MANLDQLQAHMRDRGIDAFVVPSVDEYLSEFTREPYKRLEWVTNFSGSTGVAIILRESGAVFVDGRYKLQCRREAAGLPLEVLDADDAAQARWLAENKGSMRALAVDTRVMSLKELNRLERLCGACGLPIEVLDANPVDAVWTDRADELSVSEIFDYDTAFAGDSAVEKARGIAGHLRAKGLNGHLVCDPEDVAWLLNVRTDDCRKMDRKGWQVLPIPLTRAFIEADGGVRWFVEAGRLDPGLRERIGRDGVELCDPASFEPFLLSLSNQRVSANLGRTSARYADLAGATGPVSDDSVVAHSRWRKTPTEIQAARNGHDKDGLATIRFLTWLQDSIASETISEMDAAAKLHAFRGEDPAYRGPSMPFMSAVGPSAAMPHYVPNADSHLQLNDHPLYLIDSGAQYLGCSTDNTICFALAPPSREHIFTHTLVIKGWIALATTIFPVGTTSIQLDAIARQPMWNAGLDYKHGTGHGVGNFMNIHEGPHIRAQVHHPMISELEVGMILSNEPGYYKEGEFGIRVESHIVVVESQYQGFLAFETLSSLPIDPELVDPDMLTANELAWLQDYHRGLLSRYQARLDEQSAAWLSTLVAKFDAMEPPDRG